MRIDSPVTAGHSRSKNGVASLAYVPAIHDFLCRRQDVDARIRGHDEEHAVNYFIGICAPACERLRAVPAAS